MKYPKYGEWCKQNILETIRKKIIHETKEYLNDFIFNPNSDLYSSGVHDYEVCDILWSINDDLDDPSKSLFSAVQHEFADKYFQVAQEANPEMDMKAIRCNDSEYMDLMYKTLENMSIDEIKDVIMYALDYGTEEIEGAKIPYVKTNTENINKVINSNLVEIESVYINYIDPEIKQKNIPIDDFISYLMNFSQSGIFAETINWRYVDLFDCGNYLIEGDINHNNGYELNVGIAAKNIDDKDKVVEILRESVE